MRSSYIIAIIVVLIVAYMLLMQDDITAPDTPLPDDETSLTGDTQADDAEEAPEPITIRVPADKEAFHQAIIDHVQVGGPDPVPRTERVTQSVEALTGEADILSTKIRAAANVYPPGGGPEQVEIVLLHVADGTGYIMLNIDVDGRAGVSVAQGLIHPLVTQTMLSSPAVDTVVRDYPPLDILREATYPLADDVIISDLQTQDASELIGVEGVLGGQIGFYDETQIWDIGHDSYLVYREDGHILGYALLRNHDGSWRFLHNYTEL